MIQTKKYNRILRATKNSYITIINISHWWIIELNLNSNKFRLQKSAECVNFIIFSLIFNCIEQLIQIDIYRLFRYFNSINFSSY